MGIKWRGGSILGEMSVLLSFAYMHVSVCLSIGERAWKSQPTEVSLKKLAHKMALKIWSV